jgi:hypothetical protein
MEDLPFEIEIGISFLIFSPYKLLLLFYFPYVLIFSSLLIITNKNSVALVRERTIPSDRPALGEVSANFSR